MIKKISFSLIAVLVLVANVKADWAAFQNEINIDTARVGVLSAEADADLGQQMSYAAEFQATANSFTVIPSLIIQAIDTNALAKQCILSADFQIGMAIYYLVGAQAALNGTNSFALTTYLQTAEMYIMMANNNLHMAENYMASAMIYFHDWLNPPTGPGSGGIGGSGHP